MERTDKTQMVLRRITAELAGTKNWHVLVIAQNHIHAHALVNTFSNILDRANFDGGDYVVQTNSRIFSFFHSGNKVMFVAASSDPYTVKGLSVNDVYNMTYYDDQNTRDFVTHALERLRPRKR